MEEVKLTKEQISARIWELEVSIAEAKAEQDKLKAMLQTELTTSKGYESYKDEYWAVYHKLGAVSTKFDETRYAKENPQEYSALLEKYTKTSISKDSWNWNKQKKIVEKDGRLEQ